MWQLEVIQKKKNQYMLWLLDVHSSAEKREHDALDAQCIAHHMVCSSCVGNCVSMKSVIILRKSVGTVAAGGSSDA